MTILLVLILLAGVKMLATSHITDIKRFIERNAAEGAINLVLAPVEFFVSPLLGSFMTMLFVTYVYTVAFALL